MNDFGDNDSYGDPDYDVVRYFPSKPLPDDIPAEQQEPLDLDQAAYCFFEASRHIGNLQRDKVAAKKLLDTLETLLLDLMDVTEQSLCDDHIGAAYQALVESRKKEAEEQSAAETWVQQEFLPNLLWER